MPPEPLAKLIIVDDEAAQMRALCDTLEDRGYAVMGFTSANAALETLRKQKFDLLLTDLMMEEMDGITLLRKAQEIDPELVGIIMTGHGTVDTAVEAMKSGALDYILKPFKLSVVLPVITRALAVKRLRKENEVLQQRVRERTVELEAANKELEAFTYSVSHDLRSPLRAITNFSDMLKESYEAQIPESGRELLERLCVNAKRMEQLIEDLLNLSRFIRQPLAKRPVDMAALVQNVRSELQREQEGRAVDIRVAALPACVGDPSLLQQVLVNLVSNALKFTRGRERAVIEIGFEDHPNEVVYFVRDNGAGFNMKYADKLFGVFQRLHRADEFEGTGIGLSIVKRIIDRHGGRTWADAKVGEGATFYFSLPKNNG